MPGMRLLPRKRDHPDEKSGINDLSRTGQSILGVVSYGTNSATPAGWRPSSFFKAIPFSHNFGATGKCMPHARRVRSTRGCTGNQDSFAGLPVEFCADLPFTTTVAGSGHHTKRAAVEIAIGIAELCMIRDVEEFKAQLKRERFL